MCCASDNIVEGLISQTRSSAIDYLWHSVCTHVPFWAWKASNAKLWVSCIEWSATIQYLILQLKPLKGYRKVTRWMNRGPQTCKKTTQTIYLYGLYGIFFNPIFLSLLLSLGIAVLINATLANTWNESWEFRQSIVYAVRIFNSSVIWSLKSRTCDYKSIYSSRLHFQATVGRMTENNPVSMKNERDKLFCAENVELHASELTQNSLKLYSLQMQ